MLQDILFFIFITFLMKVMKNNPQGGKEVSVNPPKSVILLFVNCPNLPQDFSLSL